MSNERVAVCVPSRGRRVQFQAFLDSFDATHTGHAQVLLRNGLYDPDLESYSDIDHPCVTRMVGRDDGFEGWPTSGYCFAMQDLWWHHPGFAAYSMMEDDCTLLDEGWDHTLLDRFAMFPDRVGLVRWEVGGITVLAASREWCERLGYFMLRELREQAWEGLLLLAGARIIDGPRLAHWPQARGQYRNDMGFSRMDPEVVALYQADCARLAAWREGPEFIHDRQLLGVDGA